MLGATSLVPRLISVVEIVKREYLRKLDAGLAKNGALAGLFQYNELGTIDEDWHSAVTCQETRRSQSMSHVLSGKA